MFNRVVKVVFTEKVSLNRIVRDEGIVMKTWRRTFQARERLQEWTPSRPEWAL